MRTRLEKAFALGLFALLLGLAVAAQILQPSERSLSGSAASATERGRRALLLLLREAGFRADAWNDAPGLLPRDGALLWLARAPRPHGEGARTEDAEDEDVDEEEAHADGERAERSDPEAEQSDPEAEQSDPDHETARADPESGAEPSQRSPSPAMLGLRAPWHYRRFVEDGGTLLIPFSEDARAFLVDSLELEACAEIESSRAAAAGPRRVRDLRGELLEVDVEAGGVLTAPIAGSGVSALWWAEGSGGEMPGEVDEVLAAVVPAGSGQVVILGSSSFLDNAKIGERDHALLAVRLAEEFARGHRVLFDQYALGLWRPRTAVSFLTSPSLFLASLHLLLLLLLLVWRSTWVREFPRDPIAHESVAPLQRARSLASLLVHAGRQDLLARLEEEASLRVRDRRGGKQLRAARTLGPHGIAPGDRGREAG